jgi:RNA polymerase sigma factor (sigma-70 family)
MLIQIDYFINHIEPDWRVLAMQFLEYDIVCMACNYNIYGYSNEDLAQEARTEVWRNLDKFDGERAGLRTWGLMVVRSHFNHLDEKATRTKKRRDYLCEPIHDMQI